MSLPPSAPRTEDQIAIIGAGPSGLAAACRLAALGLPFQGFEAHHAIGGLWDATNPRSRAYASLRMVTSKARTALPGFPMPDDVSDYPGRDDALRYLRAYAGHHGLVPHFRCGTLVLRVEPVSEKADSLWRVTVDDGHGPQTADYLGVIVANGIHAEPRVPRLPGRYEGELMHASAYRDAQRLAGRRVLVIGGGNSACDIAVDATSAAMSVDLSVRRGIHVWPRFLEGRPSDTVQPWWRRLPRPLRLRAAARHLRRVAGDPLQHGFPPPEHALDELPPVINDELLPLIACGGVKLRPGPARMDGRSVHFTDGSQGEYDLVIAATGYKLHYPFLRPELINWQGAAPRLHLNVFPAHYQRLAVLGMIEGQGVGWQERDAQAALVARYYAAQARDAERAAAFAARIRSPQPDLRGGRTPPRLDRAAVLVDAESYRAHLQQALATFDG